MDFAPGIVHDVTRKNRLFILYLAAGWIRNYPEPEYLFVERIFDP